jgi:hypothetical protein
LYKAASILIEISKLFFHSFGSKLDIGPRLLLDLFEISHFFFILLVPKLLLGQGGSSFD